VGQKPSIHIETDIQTLRKPWICRKKVCPYIFCNQVKMYALNSKSWISRQRGRELEYVFATNLKAFIYITKLVEYVMFNIVNEA
jgi:hypothetical protein